MDKQEFVYPAILESSDAGHFIEILDFPNVFSWDENEAEAIRVVTENLTYHLFHSGTFKHPQDIPEPDQNKYDQVAEDKVIIFITISPVD